MLTNTPPVLTDPPPEFVRTASDRRALELGYKWSTDAVDHVLQFADTLRDPMNPDKRYGLLDWERSLTVPLFGWRRPSGRRRFAQLNVWVPKKNGKSSWVAFLALVFLLADGERRPGCYATSSTGELAEDIYTEAKALLHGTPWRQILNFRNFRHTIECGLNGGLFKTLAASAEGAEGLKGSFVVLDEIHATLKRKPRLYGSLRYAGSGRRQPLTATISTAGDDRQALPWKIYQRAKRILAGEIVDVRTLAAIWEAEDKPIEEYGDADFLAGNPGIGEVLELEQLRDDWAEASTSDHAAEDFKRYRLGVWTKRSTAWLDVNQWTACCEPDFPLTSLAGLAGFVGVDLSSVLDLTAAVAVFPLPDGRYFWLPHFWLPRAAIEPRCANEMDYVAAEIAGDITLIDGPTIDYDHVQAWIEDLVGRYKVDQVGFDPWRASELAKQLEGAGLDVVGVKQGWAISEPCRKVESQLATGGIVHAGNSVMAWNIENAECRTDVNGKIRLVKPQDKRKRIDGLVAGVCATFLAMFAESTEYVYG